jgi:hypothetical protein
VYVHGHANHAPRQEVRELRGLAVRLYIYKHVCVFVVTNTDTRVTHSADN